MDGGQDGAPMSHTEHNNYDYGDNLKQGEQYPSPIGTGQNPRKQLATANKFNFNQYNAKRLGHEAPQPNELEQ